MNINTNKEIKILEENIIRENPFDFAKKVEDLVWMKDLPYIDAVLQIVEEEQYEMDMIPKLLTKELMFKIQEEASTRKLLKPVSKPVLTSLSKFLKKY